LRCRAVICAGLCAGWAIASRYTNIILLPALIVFFAMIMAHFHGNMLLPKTVREPKRVWVAYFLAGALAVGVAVSPMLMKNWLLVGCPLAPHIGCQDTYWAGTYGYSRQNLAVVDLLFYPFVWTFASRADMLGNISPLFIGLLPFFLLTYRFDSLVRSTYLPGLAGLASLATWLLLEPLILFTRWLLIPLSLFTIPLSAALVTLEEELHYAPTSRWLVRSAIFIIFCFLLFQSRSVIYATRYIASIDKRSDKYVSKPYYDIGLWLNTYVQPGQRVALEEYDGYYYFINEDILLNSESMEELQWLWDHRDNTNFIDVCNFYAKRGFTYVVLRKEYMNDISQLTLNENKLRIVFVGQKKMIGRIEN
jgi:hypothetical protein